MTNSDPTSSYGESTSVAYGVTVFAGVMLAALASFQILQGLAAVLKDDVYVRGVDYTYKFDVSTWGWIHLLIGVIGVAVGIGILYGQVWATVGGLVIAVVSALSQFMFMPYYPFWSMLLIFMDIVVIWALATRLGDSDA
ncbi:MAG: DUF7144 family membrane protein [Nocardioides sp.]